MTRIKKLCALVLAVMMVVTAGVISVNAAQSSDSDAVSADTTETGITIHVRMSDGTQPYVYLWNSLPTNSAMSKSYPGEKMTKGDKWYNYHVADVTAGMTAQPATVMTTLHGVVTSRVLAKSSTTSRLSASAQSG